MTVIDELKERVQYYLMNNRPSFDYKGHTFNCYYNNYPNPVNLKNYCRIEIVMPPELRSLDFHVMVQTMEMPTTRSAYFDEKAANAWKLADYFVEEILPKVDFTLERIKYERDVDEVLSILD